MNDLSGKKVGILGLGEENKSLLKFLVKKNAEITICDQKERGELEEVLSEIDISKISLRPGADYLDNLSDFDIVFRTPGIPYLNSKIQEAKASGIEISSEIKLFFQLCPCAIVGITGTKGKGTTSSLLKEIMTSSFKKSKLNSKVFLGGNIGNPPIGFLEEISANDLVILELSSFQLQDMDISPHVAIVLDIKEDHLDYHQTRDEYIRAKENIVSHQMAVDFAVINKDYEVSSNFSTKTQAKIFWFSRNSKVDCGVWLNDKNELILQEKEKSTLIFNAKELTLKGRHNIENVSAAMLAAHTCGAQISDLQTAKNFKGLEHRLEYVKEIDKVKYYNDSFSTTPDTTIAAINSFSEPIILFVGGSEKNADYSNLATEIEKSSVKMIINIGQTGKKIISLLKNPKDIKIIRAITSLEQAVKLAKENSKAGDVVILSPASASFDKFKNYKERGTIFKKLVLTSSND